MKRRSRSWRRRFKGSWSCSVRNEADYDRLEAEEATWVSLLPPTSKSASKKPSPVPASSSSLIDRSLLSESQQALLALLDPHLISTPESSESIPRQDGPFSSSIASRVNALMSNLEPTVDLLADGVHQLQQFNQHASQVADRVKGVWAKRLDKRDEEARKDAQAEEFGARDVLRALSGKLNE